jgi:beta-barrel assembly-enhancing protease
MLRKYTSLLIAVAISFTLSACGTNPVTKKKEFQFVSQEKEIAIGKENYSPARQSQGGDYVIDPELTALCLTLGRCRAVKSRLIAVYFTS